jgi:hypothetical protein
MDTAIVEAIDLENHTITLINYTVGRTYTLEYIGTTVISDKFDQALTMAQIQLGDIVDVCFMKDSKRLVSIKLSPDAFNLQAVTRYSLDSQRGSATIGDETFRLNSSAFIISEGQRIDASDIVAQDVVTIRGIDREVLSVIVQKGHGYLRLTNDSYAIGGWIEIGNSVIQRITEGMLLTVPEGAAEVFVSHRGFNTTRRVTIERNKETVIDLGGVEVEEAWTGRVIFTINPAKANVYIDGELTDVSGVVELGFGLHQIACEAEGYDTIIQYIKVSQDIASIFITMDPAGANSGTEGGGTDNSVSGPSIAPGANRVYVDYPIEVEVYVDGVYMGLAPLYFEKKAGSHTITLRRTGYITKSYTVYLDDDANDVTYSFSSLEKNIDSGHSVSGNDNP